MESIHIKSVSLKEIENKHHLTITRHKLIHNQYRIIN